MLILAGVIISSVTSNKGILSRAKDSREVYDESKAEEQVRLLMNEYAMASAEAGTKGETLTLEDYLKEKKADGTITDYKVNEDGSAEITIGDKTINVNKDLSVADNTNKGTTDSGNSETTGDTKKGSKTSGGTIPGSTLKYTEAPKISVEGLTYADFDGDNIADGIIVADISKAATDTDTYKGNNPWNGNSVSNFSYTQVTSGLNEYSDPADYTYTGGNSNVTGKIIQCTKNNGKPRYYVISLADYDSSYHTWYNNAYGNMSDYLTFTSGSFESGKTNTEKMIARGNAEGTDASDTTNSNYGALSDTDVWKVIQTEVNNGWFVPSMQQWAAFASYLNPSKTSGDTNHYVNYGLSGWYWSSSQHASFGAWFANFDYGGIDINLVNNTDSVRLCATF